MTDPRIVKLLSMGPARYVIERTSRWPLFRKVYEHLSGASRVHASMDAARDAIRRNRPDNSLFRLPRIAPQESVMVTAVLSALSPASLWAMMVTLSTGPTGRPVTVVCSSAKRPNRRGWASPVTRIFIR